MDLSLPSEVRQQLEGFSELLGNLEASLKPFTAPSSKASIAQLEPLERAQTQLALAHAAHALLQLLLRASGVDPAHHESSREQERLKQYTKKVRKAAAEKELSESRRSLEVNVSAVNRFITAAVPDLSREQRAALREAGQKRKAAAAAGGGAERQAADEDAAGAAEAFLQEAMQELQGAQPGQEQQAAGAQQRGSGGSTQKVRRG